MVNSVAIPRSSFSRQLFQQQRFDLGQPCGDALVGEHALGALVDEQADETAVDFGGGVVVGVAVGWPVADDFGAPALEFFDQREQRTAEAVGVAFLSAEAEEGDALAAEVGLGREQGEKLFSVRLEAAG